jgi:hypothetical protein
MSFAGSGDGARSTGEPDDESSPDVLNQFLDSVMSPLPLCDVLPETAAPSDAFSVFMEIVKRHIPEDKQKMLAVSCGAASVEAALSVRYVCGLALDEIRARVALGYAGR